MAKRKKIKLHQTSLIDQILEYERQKRIEKIGPRKKMVQMELFEFDKI